MPRSRRSTSKLSETSSVSHRTTRGRAPATSNVIQISGNPYLDAERERDGARALLDRALKNSKTYGKKHGSVDDEAEEAEEVQIASTSKVTERKSVTPELPELDDAEQDDEVDFVIDGILNAQYLESYDESQEPYTGWFYSIKWHNYTIEETASEDPITWRMLGPRPNNYALSFWQELRKWKLAPPLKNPEEAKAMKKEMLREKQAEEQGKRTEDSAIKERTDEEWEEWWLQLRDEWEPDGQIGQVFDAPIRLENKWYREALENYKDDRKTLVRLLKQHKANAQWIEYEKNKLALAKTDLHIADAQKRADETRDEVLRMGLKLFSIGSESEEGGAKTPVTATSSTWETPESVQPAIAADQVIERGVKRSRIERDIEDASTVNPRPKKKAARRNDDRNLTTQTRLPAQAEPRPKVSLVNGDVRVADSGQPGRLPPPPSSLRGIPSRPPFSPATEFRRKSNLFAGDDSDDEPPPVTPGTPSTSGATKGSVHRPKWELQPSFAQPSNQSRTEQAREAPLAAHANDHSIQIASSPEPTVLHKPGSHATAGRTPAPIADVAFTQIDGSNEYDRELWGSPDPESPAHDVAQHQDFGDEASVVPEQRQTINVDAAGAQVIDEDDKKGHPLIRSETGFRLCISDLQGNNQFIARVAVWPETTSADKTLAFASALSTPGPSPQDVTFILCLPANAGRELLRDRPIHQTGTLVLSRWLEGENKAHQDRLLLAMMDGLIGQNGRDNVLFAQLPKGLAIVVWHSASQSFDGWSKISKFPAKLVCALVTLDFEQALIDHRSPQSALANPVDSTVALEVALDRVRLDELGFTSSFFDSLRGVKVAIWADLLRNVLQGPAKDAGWILADYGDINVPQVIIIENRYVPELLDSVDLREAVDNGLKVFAVGPDPHRRARSEKLRPILRVRSGGGIVTFPPLFILKEPDLFSKVVQALRNNPFWTTYLLPQAVATIVSNLNKTLCRQPASVVSAMMEMLDVVTIRPPCPESLATRVKQLPLEHDLDLASDWKSWIKACESFPMSSLPGEYVANGLDRQILALEVAQLEDIVKRLHWAVGEDYEFNRAYYAGSDCSLFCGCFNGSWNSPRTTSFEKIKRETAEEFLSSLSIFRYD